MMKMLGGVVLNTIVNGFKNYYLVYTNEGEKRYFAEDELASAGTREENANPEVDEETVNTWIAGSFIEFLLNQIPENECFLHIENEVGDDHILLKFSWKEEQTAEIDVKCTFGNDDFIFNELEIDYRINTYPFATCSGSFRIDLGEDEEKDICQTRICKSLKEFLEHFSEYESIVEFLEMYGNETPVSTIIEETENGGLVWDYEGVVNEEDAYRSSDDNFDFKYMADKEHDYHLYISNGTYRIGDYFDEDLSLLEVIENAANEEEDEDEDEDISIVGTKDIFVRTTMRSCYFKEHNLETLTATVTMMDFSGQNYWEEPVTVFYCRECRRYYLYESDYYRLKSKGNICCRVVDITVLAAMIATGANWQAQSVLKQYGYSVSKTDGLSQNERQAILSFIIENDILSKSRVCEYLNWFIKMAYGLVTRKEAISKWQSDLVFVENYSKGDRKIRVGDIYRLKKVHDF